jgi:rsbT co-antagonist protein RsbR
MAVSKNSLGALLRKRADDVEKEWIALQKRDLSARNNLLNPGELEQQSGNFLSAFATAIETAPNENVLTSQAWAATRDFLTSVSRSRVRQGFTPTETATFIFSLKQPLFALLSEEIDDPKQLGEAVWTMTGVIDQLGLQAMESYQKGREEIINRQQQELLELSTPVVSLWEGILALPLIGTLDSARTQVVLESLLQAIVETESSIAIIDITGVPVVDTLVAQHLLKTVAAARLMGADCIISGIRPQIAQTIVHLGVEINDVITKATLADALNIALQRIGLHVVRKN